MKVLILSVTSVTTRHRKAESIDGDKLERIGIYPQIW